MGCLYQPLVILGVHARSVIKVPKIEGLYVTRGPNVQSLVSRSQSAEESKDNERRLPAIDHLVSDLLAAKHPCLRDQRATCAAIES